MRYGGASVGGGRGGGREGDGGGSKDGGESGYNDGLRNARPLLGKIRSDFFVHPVASKH